jgi:hypothetical protein
MADVRNRLSRGSALMHTGQWQRSIGTPAEVPVPRNSISSVVNIAIS